MTRLTCFDVLIVYTETVTTSASDPSCLTPFASNSRYESYNAVYGYFLEVCQKFNLNAAFATSADIIGPGFCHSFWTFKDSQWLKTKSPCFSYLIFDKFSPTTPIAKSRRQLLFSDSKIKPFNAPDLFNLFFDKQLTYEKLSGHSIPTISIGDKTLQSIKDACQTLTELMSHHPGFNDFSSDIIMKDKFGAGGRHIHKFKTGQTKKMLTTIRHNSNISYVIQPFAKFDQGFNLHNHLVASDIRLIYLNGQIVQSYVRVAKSGDFRCNEYQGGLLTYLPLNDIPASLVAKSNSIAKALDNDCSLYTLDFIISNSGNAYLLEGNTNPGLDWNTQPTENEVEAKKLIGLVVQELAVRAALV
ncbi:MAG: hypothetical protein WCV93_05200 [Candidatus Shapirobacteria bacterium]|jgi:glutathione synthase/RimK-type ligase-like ATP-grasp enzyme